VINSISDISPMALGQMKLYFEQAGFAVPVSQIVGYSQNQAQFASVIAEAHRNVAGYGDPNVSGGSGPTISNLPKGKYVLFFGGSGTGTLASNVVAYMALEVNGTVIDEPCEAQGTAHYSTARVVLSTMTTDANTVKAVYKTNDGTDRGDFRNRWIVAQRYANL
jgi:hypothetical protein